MICVNYNSFSDLVRYAKSVFGAAKNAEDLDLVFAIADNSSKFSEADSAVLAKLFYDHPGIVMERYENLGYFPAASKLWNSVVKNHEFDYVIVSNVDLELSQGFFSELSAMATNAGVGALAPAVISRRGVDLNPKIPTRPSRKKLEKNASLFERLPLYLLYVALSNIKYKLLGRVRRNLSPSEIYAPHGAIVIFTNAYMREVGSIAYPMFLYGEEIFVAEECRRRGLKIRYEPALRVDDFDHGATSMQAAGFKAAEHAKSLRYLLSTYF